MAYTIAAAAAVDAAAAAHQTRSTERKSNTFIWSLLLLIRFYLVREPSSSPFPFMFR
jgi:hypothetical protein